MIGNMHGNEFVHVLEKTFVAMTAGVESQDDVRGVLESLSDQKIVLSVPGTDYQIHLVPTVPASDIRIPVGKRVKGTIHAKALRMFAANGGGQFIEPIWGEPRIVAGLVLAVDEPNRRVLVHTGVPMWMTLEDRQAADLFKVGQLVNCYVQSGTQFTPTQQ
jgi:hypothetical protein